MKIKARARYKAGELVICIFDKTRPNGISTFMPIGIILFNNILIFYLQSAYWHMEKEFVKLPRNSIRNRLIKLLSIPSCCESEKCPPPGKNILSAIDPKIYKPILFDLYLYFHSKLKVKQIPRNAYFKYPTPDPHFHVITDEELKGLRNENQKSKSI